MLPSGRGVGERREGNGREGREGEEERWREEEKGRERRGGEEGGNGREGKAVCMDVGGREGVGEKGERKRKVSRRVEEGEGVYKDIGKQETKRMRRLGLVAIQL